MNREQKSGAFGVTRPAPRRASPMVSLREHRASSAAALSVEAGQPQLKGAGCEKVYQEKLTGTTADRPQLQKLITKLAHGDVVIISAVDRLSRDTTDLLIIAREMQKAGAGIRSLAEPFLDTTSDFAEIVFAILGVAAKLERCRILDRTARGRADAKAKGVKFGRKPTLTPHQQKEAIRRRDVDGETLRSIARSYNVSPQTISRLARND
jgi:DNA invertase Pin-like site-specific DNA recombinase